MIVELGCSSADITIGYKDGKSYTWKYQVPYSKNLYTELNTLVKISNFTNVRLLNQMVVKLIYESINEDNF